MSKTTIKFGLGVISGLDFRDDIVKKGSDLSSGGHKCDIKEVRGNSTVSSCPESSSTAAIPFWSCNKVVVGPGVAADAFPGPVAGQDRF